MRGKQSNYFLGGAVLLLAITAVLLKVVCSGTHGPFEYMVVGTGITALVLVAAFVVLIGRGSFR